MGFTREEIGAVLMNLTVSGIRGMITYLPEVIRQFDQPKN
jgi:hypothetical protein